MKGAGRKYYATACDFVWFMMVFSKLQSQGSPKSDVPYINQKIKNRFKALDAVVIGQELSIRSSPPIDYTVPYQRYYLIYPSKDKTHTKPAAHQTPQSFTFVSLTIPIKSVPLCPLI